MNFISETIQEAQLRVLVVDDSPTVRSRICYWLRRRFPDCACLEAESGEEAVLMAANEQPTVALVDVFLPGISGFETTRRIKARAPELPVIMLSVDKSYIYTATAAAVGATAFIAKGEIDSELYALLTALS
jgi:two-component system, NarL family, invasion response regulator UvrY